MRLTPRGLGIALVSAALIATAQPAQAVPGSASTTTPGASRIAWHPCKEEPAVQCGTLRVPIDWAKPNGATFDLAVARRRATDPAHRIGALMINPGGPGGSGVGFALYAHAYFSPEISKRFDIVGFDPRGIARSHPLVCSTELMEKQPSPVLANQAEFDRLVKFNRKLAADCRRRTGPLFDHVDTVSVVRDIDAIRVALGERKINYYGVSYGTLMGQQYAELFGKNIRAMVIDSNMDHSLNTRGFFETETATAEDSFVEFARWCEREARCALHKQGVARVWDELLAKADRGELHEPGAPGHIITPFELSDTALGVFYGPNWAALAKWLAALHSGKPAPPEVRRTLAAQRAVPAKRAGSAPGFAPVADETTENPLPVFCEDWRISVRDYRQAAQHWERARRIAPHMRMSTLGWGVGVNCVGWPGKINNPQHKLKVTNAPRILMLNAMHDPATGYNWGVNAASQLKNTATLVTYEGWGHGVYDRSSCTRRITDRYLLELRVPRPGTRCAGVEPPVPPDAAAKSVRPVPAGPLPGRPGWLADLTGR